MSYYCIFLLLSFFAESLNLHTSIRDYDLSKWRSFNMSKCQNDIKVYVYNIDIRNRTSIRANTSFKSPRPYWSLGYDCYFAPYGSLNQFNHEIVNWAKDKNSNIITSSAEEACLFVIPAIPNGCWAPKRLLQKSLWKEIPIPPADIKRKMVAKWLRRLPYWNISGEDGANHILLDFYDMNELGPWLSMGRVWNPKHQHIMWDIPFPYASLDTGKAIVLGSSLDRRSFRYGYDLSIFLTHSYMIPELNLHLPPSRLEETNHSITEKNGQKDQMKPSFKLKKKKTQELTTIESGMNTDRVARMNWKNRSSLACFFGKIYSKDCNVRKQLQQAALSINDSKVLYISDDLSVVGTTYASQLTDCMFGLVPRGKGYHSFRLMEVLSAGAIPVVINDFGVLPFEEVWDWTHLAVMFSESDMSRIMPELKRLSSDYNDMIRLHHSVVNIFEKYLEFKNDTWTFIMEILITRVRNQFNNIII
mmetsp:Transcript_28273/g.28561  ORF Transcript_28273/g.28561 Transcript_28273/m.28561 type:complete len:474 (+) Transcript_28273:37-1458(+)